MRRNIKFLIIALVGIFLFGCAGQEGFEQDIHTEELVDAVEVEEGLKEESYFDLLEELPLYAAAKNAGCTLLKEDRAYCPGDHLFPLGWSKDGKFAYFHLNVLEDAIGGYQYHFRIEDLKTDEVVWEMGECLVIFEMCNVSVDEFWQEKQNDIKNKFEEYGIISTISFELQEFSEGSLDISVVWEDGGDFIKAFLYKERGVKEKEIYSKKKEDLLQYVYSPGYLKSPYEERIVVFIAREIRGWEGPPNPIKIDIIGSALERGFVERMH